MLNVCSVPSKLGVSDFIESHAINCFVETKIEYIVIDIYNVNMPEECKGNI